MPAREPRKLQRGLSDISEIFHRPGSAAVSEAAGLICEEPRVMSIACPGLMRQASTILALLAGRLSHMGALCRIVELREPVLLPSAKSTQEQRHWYPRIPVTLRAWQREQQAEDAAEIVPPPQICLLDADFAALDEPKMVFRALDQLVLILRPSLDSVIETYRLIKTAHFYNPEMDFFILFEKEIDSQQTAEFFEQFSSVVFRHLEIPLWWIGTLNFTRGVEGAVEGLTLDWLFIRSVEMRKSPEKWALLRYLERTETQGRGVA